MAKRNTTDLAAIERAEMQQRALNLRIASMRYDQIGAELGVSKSTAHRLVTEAIAEFKREPTEELIDLEVHRLDTMFAGLYPDAASGDPKAVGAALRIMDRRAKYFALDQRAVLMLANDTKALSAFDEFAKAMLGRAPDAAPENTGKLDVDEVDADHIDDLP